jgi:glycosyltransferase involved in cell wall biosynthesis
MDRPATSTGDLRRVYLVTWWLADFGGTERHITELAKCLHNRGVAVTVFTEMPISSENQYRRELREAGIPVEAPRIPLAFVNWWQQRYPAEATSGPDLVSKAMGPGFLARLLRFTLERAVRRDRPDVIHVHGWLLRQWVVTWCALRGIPAIYTEHSTISDWGGPSIPSAGEFLVSAADVACVSESARQSLAPWLGGRPLALHRHIVRLPGEDASSPRAPGVLKVVSVARLRAEKGLDVLLRAAGQLRAGGLDFELEIVGDGPLRDQLHELRRELQLEGHVTISGSSTADVATAVGGIPEVIADGKTGLLVPAESVGALATAIWRLAEDREFRMQLGRDARASFASGPYGEDEGIRSVLASYDKARKLATAG